MPWQPIDQLAATEQRLGTARAEFAYSFKHYLYRLVFCGGGVLFGLFFVYLAFQMTREGWIFPIVLMLIALGILGGSGYVIHQTLAWPQLRVMVFPAGLLHIERDRFIVLYWGQIESVWEEHTVYVGQATPVEGRRTHVYTVKLTNGDQVIFQDRIHDVVGLGEIIAEETTRRMLPQALKKYNEGGVISFGKWSVSQAGLKSGSKTIPWETLGKVEAINGIFLIKQEGKFLPTATEEASKIPNLSLFLELIEALRGDIEQVQ